ncbi:hypothetical protein [Alteromonas sp. 14N.309.X.WAT.G.H12]|uniref:hypothetical protein n=1 Tax=Alteromonas sp. 14N.309.X.WAT.G.H12 TaxID=3120824 RepID=UPI002FD2FF09
MPNRIILILMLFCGVSLSVHAEYTSTDWVSEGDGLITVDSSTGLEWLDLSETIGMSISDVQEELEEGGLFYGWRLPTYEEVYALTTGIYGQLTDVIYGESYYEKDSVIRDETEQEVFETWFSLFGEIRNEDLGNAGHVFSSLGFHLDEDGNVVRSGLLYQTTNVAYDTLELSIGHDIGFTEDSSSSNQGVFLVSDGGMALTAEEETATVVSAPFVGSFSGIVLLLLGRRLKKKEATLSRL